jgi:hypothetical protein
MRLLVSGSSGAVNPSVSVSFKEDIIRPINDKKNSPKSAVADLAKDTVRQPEQILRQPEQTLRQSEPRVLPPEQPRMFPPEMPKAPAPLPKISGEPIRPEIPVPRINPDKPVELDIVTELTKELLPTAIQRFNVCYCDTCYQAMTEAVAKRSPKIVVMLRSKDDLARAEYLKKQNRNNVLRTVIKEVLEYKTTGKHQNIEIRK